MPTCPAEQGKGCAGGSCPTVFFGGLWGYGGPEEVVGPMRLRVGGNVGAKRSGEGIVQLCSGVALSTVCVFWVL